MIDAEDIKDWLENIGNYGMGGGYWIPSKESFEQLCQLALKALPPEDALRLPLRNLMKESAAMLALCEPQLREAAGNTNVAVFLQRITEAAEAFEQHAPQKGCAK